MASFTERIRLIFDVDNNMASKGFKSFGVAVREAEGFTGKLGAGLSSIGGSLKSFFTSAQGATVGALALGAGMFASVTAAEHLALAVGKLRDATGLSTDAASRWLEVGSDLGISAEQISGLIGKLSVNLGKSPAQFEALGVSVKHVKDGSVDMNGTLLNAIDVLNKTDDVTKRNALAQQLFGKSWKDASELIVAGSDAVGKKLDEVDKHKIVDQKQIDEARKFRDTMDDLKDVGEELAVAIGQALIPVLNEVVPIITEVVGAVITLTDAVGDVTGALDFMPSVIDTDKLLAFKAAIEATNLELDNSTDFLTSVGDANKQAAQAAYQHSVQQDALAVSSANLAMTFRDEKVALQDLKDELADEQALISFNDAMADMGKEIETTGTVSDATRLRVENLALGLNNITSGRAEQFKIAIDTGDIERAIMLQGQLAALAAIPIDITLRANFVADAAVRNLMEGRGIVQVIKDYTRRGGVL